MIRYSFIIFFFFFNGVIMAQGSKDIAKEKQTFIERQINNNIKNYFGLLGNLIGSKLSSIEKDQISSELEEYFINSKIRISNDLREVARKDLNLREYFDYFSQYSHKVNCDIAIDTLLIRSLEWNKKENVYVSEVLVKRLLINPKGDICDSRIFKTDYCSFFFRINPNSFSPFITNFQSLKSLPKSFVENKVPLSVLTDDLALYGASIYIDNVFHGIIPSNAILVTPGLTEIVVKKENFHTFRIKKDIVYSSVIKVSMKEKNIKLNKALGKVKSNAGSIGLTVGVFLLFSLLQP